MTRIEFLEKVPDIINHKAHGYGELEVICDTKFKKWVCYRHKNGTASGGNHASTWDLLYEKVMEYLKNSGYIN